MIARVTQLEKFRRWRDGVSEFDTEQSVLDTLSGAFTGNEYTWIGTAFHKIVEQGGKAWEDGIVHTAGGDVFMNEMQKNVAILYRNTMPEAFHETRLSKQYPTNHGTVTGVQPEGFAFFGFIRKQKKAVGLPAQIKRRAVDLALPGAEFGLRHIFSIREAERADLRKRGTGRDAVSLGKREKSGIAEDGTAVPIAQKKRKKDLLKASV